MDAPASNTVEGTSSTQEETSRHPPQQPAERTEEDEPERVALSRPRFRKLRVDGVLQHGLPPHLAVVVALCLGLSVVGLVVQLVRRSTAGSAQAATIARLQGVEAQLVAEERADAARIASLVELGHAAGHRAAQLDRLLVQQRRGAAARLSSLEAKNRALNQQLASQADDILAIQASVSQGLETLQGNLEHQQALTRTLEEELSRRDALPRKAAAELAREKEKASQLGAALRVEQRSAQELRAVAVHGQGALTQVSAELREQRRESAELQAALSERDAEVDRLEAQLARENATVTGLKDALTSEVVRADEEKRELAEDIQRQAEHLQVRQQAAAVKVAARAAAHIAGLERELERQQQARAADLKVVSDLESRLERLQESGRATSGEDKAPTDS